MRPNSIVWFERVVIVSLVLGIGSTLATWGETASAVEQAGANSNFILGITLFFFALFALLLWFISRRRSQVAAWIYVALCAISIVTQLAGFSALLALDPFTMIVALIQLALTIASLVLLGAKPSRNFLAGKDDPQYDQVFD